MEVGSITLGRPAFYAAIIYGVLGIAFTLLGMFLASPQVEVGGTRPENTIPIHLAELAAFGLVLGLGGMLIYGRGGLPLVILLPTLTILLDVDHIPVYIGYAEPIRPAHSLVFLFVAVALAAITIKALDIELAMASAFMAHMAVDTGLFPPFSPLSFDYVQVDPYRFPFAVMAVGLAIAAGIELRMKRSAKTNG